MSNCEFMRAIVENSAPLLHAAGNYSRQVTGRSAWILHQISAMNLFTKATKNTSFVRPETRDTSRSESAGRMNAAVANRLDEVAQILEEQGANIFRVGAYRRAAALLRDLQRPIDEIVRTEGLEGLQKLPGIGETLARFIHQLVMTGRLPMLNTPRAHQLNKTLDWVVIYYDGAGGERQGTVITSMYGPLAGRRIVRGREAECMQHYRRPIQRTAGPGKIQDGFSL